MNCMRLAHRSLWIYKPSIYLCMHIFHLPLSSLFSSFDCIAFSDEQQVKHATFKIKPHILRCRRINVEASFSAWILFGYAFTLLFEWLCVDLLVYVRYAVSIPNTERGRSMRIEGNDSRSDDRKRSWSECECELFILFILLIPTY